MENEVLSVMVILKRQANVLNSGKLTYQYSSQKQRSFLEPSLNPPTGYEKDHQRASELRIHCWTYKNPSYRKHQINYEKHKGHAQTALLISIKAHNWTSISSPLFWWN